MVLKLFIPRHIHHHRFCLSSIKAETTQSWQNKNLNTFPIKCCWMLSNFTSTLSTWNVIFRNSIYLWHSTPLANWIMLLRSPKANYQKCPPCHCPPAHASYCLHENCPLVVNLPKGTLCSYWLTSVKEILDVEYCFGPELSP